MSFLLDSRPFSRVDGDDFPASCSCWTHLSRQRSSPLDEVEHRQHGEGPIGILCQTAIAHLGKAPQALQGQERVLDLGAHTRLAPVRFLVGFGQRAVSVGALVGEVLRLGRDSLEPLTLIFAPVGAVAVEAGFLAMQQLRYLVAVMDVRRGNATTRRVWPARP